MQTRSRIITAILLSEAVFRGRCQTAVNGVIHYLTARAPCYPFLPLHRHPLASLDTVSSGFWISHPWPVATLSSPSSCQLSSNTVRTTLISPPSSHRVSTGIKKALTATRAWIRVFAPPITLNRTIEQPRLAFLSWFLEGVCLLSICHNCRRSECLRTSDPSLLPTRIHSRRLALASDRYWSELALPTA